MNEQLEQYLVRTLEGLEQGLSSGMDFLAGEIPLYIQELLIWYAMKSGIMTLIGLLLISVTVYIVIKYSGVGEEDDHGQYKITLTHDNFGDLSPHTMATYPMAGFVLMCGFAMTSLEWLQILVAPRVWLLEYAASLIK